MVFINNPLYRKNERIVNGKFVSTFDPPNIPIILPIASIILVEFHKKEKSVTELKEAFKYRSVSPS